MLNYLLSIGTSNNISKIININDLINNFKVNSITASPPKFSEDVLKSLNKDILQLYEFSEIKEKFKEINIILATEEFWNFVKYNIYFFSDTVDWWKIINSNEIYTTDPKDLLTTAAELLPEEPYDFNTWDKWVEKIKEKTKKRGKDLFMPLRFALTGKETGPELKYLIPLLKKEQILKKFVH